MNRCACEQEISDKEKEMFYGLCFDCYNFEVSDAGRCDCGRSFFEYDEIEPGKCNQCVQSKDFDELEHPDQKAHEGKRLGVRDEMVISYP